jgi:cyclic pyranopterin phosphate synthase
MLIDRHGRALNYLRLAVTDRCNLRCVYCMPEEGIRYLPKKEVPTYEELLHVTRILTELGVYKVRITGGEPFVRTDLMRFLEKMAALPGIREWHMTTNGVLTAPHVPRLRELGLQSVNLSLDTLDRARFIELARRDELDAVLKTLDALIEAGIEVKINAVVMEGKNTQDIRALAGLTESLPVSVRFIEEMPFNGVDKGQATLTWNHRLILHELKTHFPAILKKPDPENSTSANYEIPGHRGTVGIIAGFSRTFCGSCNRLRVTAQGILKTCLYGDGVLDFKKAIRSGIPDEQIKASVIQAVGRKPKDGFEAERESAYSPVSESMSTIGG